MPASRLWSSGINGPTIFDKDDPVFDVIQLIASSGRTGWLYSDLVQEKRLALAAQASGTYPSGRYPALFSSPDGAGTGPHRRGEC